MSLLYNLKGKSVFNRNKPGDFYAPLSGLFMDISITASLFPMLAFFLLTINSDYEKFNPKIQGGCHYEVCFNHLA